MDLNFGFGVDSANHRGYKSAVLSRLPKLVLSLSLSLSIGLHWALLQAVAWTGMVVIYSQTAPLTVALAKTFDGKHPCKLCKLVDAGKQTEQKQESQKTSAKVEYFFVSSPNPKPLIRSVQSPVGE